MKFLFGDKVKVDGGFYKGVIGIVTDYKHVPLIEYFYDEYYIEGTFPMYGNRLKFVSTWINEKELEKLEE